MKIGIKTHTCEELVPHPHTCEKLVSNHHRWEEVVGFFLNPFFEFRNDLYVKLLYYMYTCCYTKNEIKVLTKKWYWIVTDVSDKTVNNWNRKQNAADFGVFYQREEYACVLYEIWLRAHFSQSERYWFEICDIHVLLPILHSVEFTKCEHDLRFNKACMG